MRDANSKPKIALLAMGVIGGGNLGYGIPVLRDLFERLSAHYEIIFYSFSTIDEGNIPQGIKLRQTRLPLPGRLKFLYIALKFAFDQIFHPSKLIFAISIYPTGHWAIRLGKIFNRHVLVQIIALEAVGLTDIGYGNLTVPWLKKITIKVCEEADTLVAVAGYQMDVAKKSLPTSRNIDVLPLRIDYRKFSYRKRKVSFPVQFIHVAYYSPIKDQDTMFAALASVSKKVDCHLTVIGSGYDSTSVRDILDRLQISNLVTFVGEIDQSQVPQYFRDAQILIHPARFETGCAVIQEAMASGVAVCGTRVGILSDIGDSYAMIAPPKDPEELANKIMELINNPALYDTITSKAYNWITTYDSMWSYENYRQFIDSKLKDL